ncbi:MAG: methylmalonyl Co-A mutase-associated GTPase MeaB, partial [Candidatus Aureabacteria bacterium]|nr:methylmalonyl Co-A mutase-associated GTPase MeaB [Candidatus Auribacterota bacterium]
GSGKSTLADRLIAHYHACGKRVGVLAIDPTSPLTGGAVLGDRVRMQTHATDRGVFIRSMASRDWTGGLSRAAAEAARVLEAFGSDVILIETVGVGQSEVGIAGLADTVILVCTPDAGDKIQAMKAGVTEIADILVINKADLAGAEHAARAIEMVFSLKPARGWEVPILKTVARDGAGIDKVAAAIGGHREFLGSSGLLDRKRLERERQQLVDIVRARLVELAAGQLPAPGTLDAYAGRILSGEADPYSLAEEIIGAIRFTQS